MSIVDAMSFLSLMGRRASRRLYSSTVKAFANSAVAGWPSLMSLLASAAMLWRVCVFV